MSNPAERDSEWLRQLPEASAQPLARARQAMVSTSHPAVTAAALAVLREGGNAVDALLTAMPLQHVLEPHYSTIAGGFALLYWDAARGEPRYLNAHPDHPQGTTPPRSDCPATSGARIAVPGTVQGMRVAAERYGTRPWASYFAPAIAAARDGVPLSSGLYGAMAAAFERLVHFPSGRERYLPDGRLTPVGHIFRQPRLAATLARIAEPDGAAWFQHGAFAERFVSAVGDSGGAMTLADMRAYEPRWLDPLPFAFHGEDFVGSPPPDSGGLYCGFALGVLERTSLARLGPWLTTPRALALIARVLSEADAVAARYVTDPLAFDIPVAALLAPESLATTARLIDGSFPTGAMLPLAPIGAPASFADRRDRDALPPTHSHQLVIADAHGNWALALHTGYAADFGTGLVVDGIGVNAANVFPGVGVGAGRRVCTPMAAVLGLRAGRPWLGLGTPGYPPPYVTLVLLNLLAYGMTLPEAIDAPRFRLDTQRPGPRSMWDIGQLAIETRVPAATVAGLTQLGLAVAPLGDYGLVGAVQAVMYDAETRDLLGVADTRLPGRAAGY